MKNTHDQLPERIEYGDLPIFHFSKVINNDFPEGKIKGLIFGNFGAMNYGDEAILAGQLEELYKVKHASIQVVSRFPEKITAIHAVESISTHKLGDIARAVFKSNFIIVGGGGLFCKNDTGFMGILFQLYTTLLFLALPWMLRKKIYVLGIGFYSNTNSFIASLALWFLRYATLVTVRDAHSYQFLQKNKVTVSFYKDNSFLINLSPKTEMKHDVFFRNKLDKTLFHVGIALKRGATEQEKAILVKEISTFILKNAKNTTFWFYALDAHIYYYNDKKFAEEIIKKVGGMSNTIPPMYILPTTWNPKKLFSSLQLMDFFIAMRLHASIFCYRIQIPFYGISYDTKCSSFFESIHKSYVNTQDVTASSLQNAFEKVKVNK